jgi:hypothetical protein
MEDFRISNSNIPSNDFTKKPRYSESSGFLSSYENILPNPDNLHLLSVLFPVLTQTDLIFFLKESRNNLDQAIENIQEREKLRYFDQEYHKKALLTCEQLSSSTSYEEATEVIKEFILSGKKIEIDSQLEENRMKLESLIKDTIDENSKLKKVIAWFTEKAKNHSDKGKEVARLQKLLENEKCRSYSLNCQLNYALGNRDVGYC